MALRRAPLTEEQKIYFAVALAVEEDVDDLWEDVDRVCRPAIRKRVSWSDPKEYSHDLRDDAFAHAVSWDIRELVMAQCGGRSDRDRNLKLRFGSNEPDDKMWDDFRRILVGEEP